LLIYLGESRGIEELEARDKSYTATRYWRGDEIKATENSILVKIRTKGKLE